jgi:hypothetical protein
MVDTKHKAANVNITAVWSDPASLPIDFVDQLHIQRVGDRYFLTFGQGNFPLVEGKPEADLKIQIRPVHRYVISSADLRRMIVAATTTLASEENGE